MPFRSIIFLKIRFAQIVKGQNTQLVDQNLRNFCPETPDATVAFKFLLQVNTDQVAMLLMSLGTVAVSITALGGTSVYPWLFLAGMVLAGIAYAMMQQRRRSLEAKVQSNRQMTINFVHNQYTLARSRLYF